MASDQDLAALVLQQGAELDRLRAQNNKAAVSQAVTAAIDATGLTLASASARTQLAELLAAETHLHNDPVAGQVVTGPALQPLGSWVQDRLATSHNHFVRGGGGQPARQAVGVLPAADDPNASLGARVIAHAMNLRAAAGTPGPAQTDMSQSMGIRRPR
jgi:hypothetical protein